MEKELLKQQEWLLDHQEELNDAFGTTMYCRQSGANCKPEDFLSVFSVYDTGREFMEENGICGMAALDDLMEKGLFQSVAGKYVRLHERKYERFLKFLQWKPQAARETSSI